MARRLKKAKLYELTKRLLPEETKLPMLKECEYRFYRSSEWLEFYGVENDYYRYKVATENAGAWVCIEVYSSSKLVRSDIYAELKEDGTYGHHSHMDCLRERPLLSMW